MRGKRVKKHQRTFSTFLGLRHVQPLRASTMLLSQRIQLRFDLDIAHAPSSSSSSSSSPSTSSASSSASAPLSSAGSRAGSSAGSGSRAWRPRLFGVTELLLCAHDDGDDGDDVLLPAVVPLNCDPRTISVQSVEVNGIDAMFTFARFPSFYQTPRPGVGRRPPARPKGRSWPVLEPGRPANAPL